MEKGEKCNKKIVVLEKYVQERLRDFPEKKSTFFAKHQKKEVAHTERRTSKLIA